MDGEIARYWINDPHFSNTRIKIYFDFLIHATNSVIGRKYFHGNDRRDF
jgi:hypothetical protein